MIEVPKTTSDKDAGFREIFVRGARTAEVYKAEILKYKTIMFLKSETRDLGNVDTHSVSEDEQSVLDAAEVAPKSERSVVRLAAKAILLCNPPAVRNKRAKDAMAALITAQAAFTDKKKRSAAEFRKDETAKQAAAGLAPPVGRGKMSSK